MKLTLGATLLFVGLAAPHAAAFDYQFCNDNNYDIDLSLVRSDGDAWLTEGWWSVPAGGCTDTYVSDSTPIFARAEAFTWFWDGDYLFCVDDQESNFSFSGSAYDQCGGPTRFKIGFQMIDASWDGVKVTHFGEQNHHEIVQTLDVCNRTRVDASIAVGYRKGYWAPRTYEGYWTVPAGECQTYDFPNVDAELQVLAVNTGAGLIWEDEDGQERHCISLDTSEGFFYVNPDESRVCELELERQGSFHTLAVDQDGYASFEIGGAGVTFLRP